MNLKEKGILMYIIEHCQRIEEKMKDIDLERFSSDKDVEDIVLFNILQIGELAKSLSPDFVEQYNEIPWKSIKGMRDIVAHGYGTIDIGRAFKTASEDITFLKKYCQRIMDEL